MPIIWNYYVYKKAYKPSHPIAYVKNQNLLATYTFIIVNTSLLNKYNDTTTVLHARFA